MKMPPELAMILLQNPELAARVNAYVDAHTKQCLLDGMELVLKRWDQSDTVGIEACRQLLRDEGRVI